MKHAKDGQPFAPGFPPRRSDPSPPVGLGAYRFEIDDSEYAILEWPLPKATEAPGLLTSAERTVVELVLAGCSNLEVATRRGRSIHTIANELASAYKKLGITSRAELAARVASGAPRAT